ncbi:Hsp20/alpha crystallin family protein [archaeon]|nr:MAG: Hsp20/alpha crystallin family protein [archaeon]
MLVNLLIVLVALAALTTQVQAYRTLSEFSSSSNHAKGQKHRHRSNSVIQPLFGSWGSMDTDLFFPSMSMLSQVEDVMNMMDSFGAYNARQPSRSSKSPNREGSCSNGGRMVAGLCMQMQDTELAYEYSIELPGCKKEDVKLKIVGEELYLEAERTVRSRYAPGKSTEAKDSSTPEDKSNNQKINRVLSLPEDASKLNIEAEMQDGVLTLMVPKVKPTEPPVINVLVK